MIENSNSTDITKLGRPTSRRIALGSPSLIAICSPHWEEVLGSVSTPWVRLQIAVSGAPAYNPIISLQAKMQLWFCFNLFTVLFVSPCES